MAGTVYKRPRVQSSVTSNRVPSTTNKNSSAHVKGEGIHWKHNRASEQRIRNEILGSVVAAGLFLVGSNTETRDPYLVCPFEELVSISNWSQRFMFKAAGGEAVALSLLPEGMVRAGGVSGTSRTVIGIPMPLLKKIQEILRRGSQCKQVWAKEIRALGQSLSKSPVDSLLHQVGSSAIISSLIRFVDEAHMAADLIQAPVLNVGKIIASLHKTSFDMHLQMATPSAALIFSMQPLERIIQVATSEVHDEPLGCSGGVPADALPSLTMLDEALGNIMHVLFEFPLVESKKIYYATLQKLRERVQERISGLKRAANRTRPETLIGAGPQAEEVPPAEPLSRPPGPLLPTSASSVTPQSRLIVEGYSLSQLAATPTPVERQAPADGQRPDMAPVHVPSPLTPPAPAAAPMKRVGGTAAAQTPTVLASSCPSSQMTSKSTENPQPILVRGDNGRSKRRQRETLVTFQPEMKVVNYVLGHLGSQIATQAPTFSTAQFRDASQEDMRGHKFSYRKSSLNARCLHCGMGNRPLCSSCSCCSQCYRAGKAMQCTKINEDGDGKSITQEPNGRPQAADIAPEPVEAAALLAEEEDPLLGPPPVDNASAQYRALQRRFDRAVHSSFSGGDFDPVMSLLHYEKGLINFQRLSGETALHAAAWMGREDVAQELLKMGANPSLKDSNGLSPLDLAKRRNYSTALTEMLSAPK